MKKIILIGATILVASTAVLVAANSSCPFGCDDCPMAICKPNSNCDKADCCKK
ncbi:MAG: hypothetical protein H0U95_05150 [Bacteroidetes bacterium]|nr:hypothetical protein [Bacteroidota bacterium]